MRRFLVVVALCLPLGACYRLWGTPPENFEPAISPVGAHVTLRLRGERTLRGGELLAANFSSVIVRAEQVVEIPWPNVLVLSVAKMGRQFDPDRGYPLDSVVLARISAVSRFPQGLRGPLLQDVLKHAGQPALVTLP